MKKVTILAAAIAIFGLSSIEANAQSTTKPQQTQQEQNQSSDEQQQDQSSKELQHQTGQGQSSDQPQQGQGQSSDELQQGQSSDQMQQGQGQGQSSDQLQEGQGMREAVSEEELPEAVKRALESDVYNDWEVEEINKVQASAAGEQQAEGQTSAVVYEITMVNAEGQRGIVRLDESGRAASDE